MKFFKLFISTTIILFFFIEAKSDIIPDPGCEPGFCLDTDLNKCVPCTEDIPIDGGASLLLIAGGAYGINKISRYRKTLSSKAI